jgi:cytochrome b involved in lipid metabolism
MSIESYQPEVFSPREHNLSKVDNFLPSHEGNNCFIIRKLLKDVYNLNVLFCKRQQNNFLHRKYNDQLRNRIEKKKDF